MGNPDVPTFEPLKYAPATQRRNLAKQAKAAEKSLPAAIKLMCRQCMGFSDEEVRRCSAPHCALWEVRKRYFKAEHYYGEDGRPVADAP